MSARRGPGRVAEWVFVALTGGYPRSFRERHAEELLATFRESWAEEVAGRGPVVAAAFWARIVWDGVVNGLGMRMSARREQGRSYAGTGRRGAASGIGHDVRFGIRGLRRHPGLASGVVITLALGIGAATAILTVVDAILVRPLPYENPADLVELRRSLSGRVILDHFTPETARGLREEVDYLDPLVPYTRMDMILAGSEPRSIRTHAVTPELFELLGRRPFLGRPLLLSDAEADAEPVAVLSYPLWRSLGGDRGIVGGTVELDQTLFTVIGVMPRDFRFPEVFPAEAFIPLTEGMRAAGFEQTRISLIGRLVSGVSVDVAASRTKLLLGALLPSETEWEGRAGRFGEHRANRDVKRALWMLAAAVGTLLLVAVVNAINLLFTRTSSREREIAVRHSLGASPLRLLRQLLTESFLLALIAGLAAVALAMAGVRLLVAIAPSALTVLAANRIAVDDRVLFFAFGLTVVVGLGFGLLPALHALRTARHRTVVASGALGSTTREKHRLRAALVVAQIAVALPLVAAAGLLGASFQQLNRVESGFQVDNLIFLQISPRERAYAGDAAVAELGQALEERIAAIPGVAAVTRASSLPPSGGFAVGAEIQVEGEAEPRADAPFLLPTAAVRPDYLPTLGARIVRGRNFSREDTPESHTTIIDRDMAGWLWPGESPLGRRFRLDGGPWLTVVGEVDELMLGGPRSETGDFAVLEPADASPANASFAVRTTRDPGLVIPAIRQAVRKVDDQQPVWRLWTAEDALAEEMARERFFLVIMAVLAAVALGLAGIGIYGLLSFVVNRRRRELGIRMALGAEKKALVRMVLASGLSMACVGIAIGLAAALATGRLLRSLLFGIEPTNPRTLTLAAAVMLGVAVLGCLLPARRATRVRPAEVLQEE